MAGIEDERDLADFGRVSQARPDRIHFSFEAIENGRHAGTSVIAELAIVVVDNTEDHAVAKVLAHRRLEVEFIIGGLIFKRRRQAERTVELQLGCGLDIGESPPKVDCRPVEARYWD